MGAARHRRRRLEGLPPQLPDPAQAGRARDEGLGRGGRAPSEDADRAAAEATQRAEESAELLNKTVLTIAHQAGDDGRLFGSVTSQDIVDAIKEARGLEIDRRKVHLEEPIRTVGTRMVTVEVGDGVLANVKTMVVEQSSPAQRVGRGRGARPGKRTGQLGGRAERGAGPRRRDRVAYRVRTAARGAAASLARSTTANARARRGARQGPLRRGVARAARARAPTAAGGCTSPAPRRLQALVDLRARRAR